MERPVLIALKLLPTASIASIVILFCHVPYVPCNPIPMAITNALAASLLCQIANVAPTTIPALSVLLPITYQIQPAPNAKLQIA